MVCHLPDVPGRRITGITITCLSLDNNKIINFVVDTDDSAGTGSTRALAYSLAGKRVRHFAAVDCNIFQPYTGPCPHLKQNNDIQNYKIK